MSRGDKSAAPVELELMATTDNCKRSFQIICRLLLSTCFYWPSRSIPHQPTCRWADFRPPGFAPGELSGACPLHSLRYIKIQLGGFCWAH